MSHHHLHIQLYIYKRVKKEKISDLRKLYK